MTVRSPGAGPSIVSSPPPGAHRKIRHIYDYWHRATPPAQRLPGRRNIDPLDIPALLENVRLVGDAMRRMGVPGKAGDFVDELIPIDSLPFVHFLQLVAERSPIWFRGQ